MAIRPATLADVAGIEQLVHAAYAPYVERIGRPPAPMTADYHAAVIGTDQVDVIVDDGALAGVLVTVAEPDHLLIENVAVAPWAQGRGHGRALLAHAEAQARQRELPQLRLYTNAFMTENLVLYPRLGYVEVDRRTENGFDRVYFVKTVRS